MIDELVKSQKNGNRRLRKKLRRQGAQILRKEAYFSVRRNKPAPGRRPGKDAAQRSIRAFYEAVND
jgi:hypothetical protein